MASLTRFPRAPFAFVLATSLSLVGGGVAMSELIGLAACPLCIIQRMVYLALACAGLVGLLVAARPLGRRLAALLMLALAALGGFVAGYQTWIQRLSPDTGCSGRMTWWEEFVDWAGSELPLLFESNGLCSDPGWKFLGLSIAEWSLGFFAGFLVLSLYTFLRKR